MTYMRSILVMAGLIGLCTGCASSTWPIGRELGRSDAGLIGEWVVGGPDQGGPAVVWRFESMGRISLLDRATVTSPGRPPVHDKVRFRGTWRVYESNLSDRRPLVCFGYRPGREWPSCHWFTIDTTRIASDVDRADSVSRRRLIWQGWAGAARTTTDTMIESRSPR